MRQAKAAWEARHDHAVPRYIDLTHEEAREVLESAFRMHLLHFK